MKRLTALLALLVLAGPAEAARTYYPWPLYDGAAWPYNRRVIIAMDDQIENAASAAFANDMRVRRQNSLGNLKSVLEENGIAVQVYNYSFFDDSTVNSATGPSKPLWTGLGAQAPVVICLDWKSYTASNPALIGRKRYFRADSCSAHIIHWGGSNNGFTWQDDVWANKDSIFGTPVNGSVLQSLAAQWCVRTGGNRDSLFSTSIAFSVRPPILPSGVDSMVTYFSRNHALPDSFMASGDTCFVASRTIFSNQGYASTAHPWVDYVLSNNVGAGNGATGGYALALIARWIDWKPLKCVFNIADIGNFGLNPWWASNVVQTNLRSPYNLSNVAWVRPGLLDTTFSRWQRNYRLVMTAGGQPDSVVSYINSQGYSLLRTYIASWDTHVHNNDSTNVFSNPFGRGSDNSNQTTVSSPASRRVAHAWNPGNATVMNRYGIAERIARQDSVFRTNGLMTSGYMTPANDDLMPGNLSTCPPESLLQAVADGGIKYFRGFPIQPSLTALYQNTATGTRYFSAPDEQYTTRDGKVIRCVGYVTLSSAQGTASDSTATGISSVNNMRLWAGTFPANLLGIVNPWPGRDNPDFLLSGESSTSNDRNVVGSRCRAIGTHLQFYSDFPRMWGDIYLIETFFLKQIRAYEELAGKPLIEWVTPGQLY